MEVISNGVAGNRESLTVTLAFLPFCFWRYEVVRCHSIGMIYL